MTTDSATKLTLEKPGPVLTVTLSNKIGIGDRYRVFVIPSTIHIGGEKSPQAIKWVNETGGPVKLWLPALGKILNHPKTQDLSAPIDLADGATSDPFVVNDKRMWGKEEFCYHYNVYCDSIQDYAQGDSEPVLSCP